MRKVDGAKRIIRRGESGVCCYHRVMFGLTLLKEPEACFYVGLSPKRGTAPRMHVGYMRLLYESMNYTMRMALTTIVPCNRDLVVRSLL